MLLFLLTILAARPLTDSLANQLALKPGVVEAMGVNPHYDTFKGLILQEEAFETPGVLPMYGSSEISLLMDYHPTHVLLPQTGVTPFLVGMGGYQTIVHVLSLASLENIEGDKLVIFVSPQWFFPGGIQKVAYAANYSPLHIYDILNNPKTVSGDLKQQIIDRLLQFPEAYADYPYLKKRLEAQRVAATSADSAPPSNRWLRLANWLPARMEYADLIYRDFFKMEWHILRLPKTTITQYAQVSQPEVRLNPQKPDWDQLRKDAEEKARKSATNNPFGMDDTFYTHNIAPKLAERQNVESSYNMTTSPEYADLQLLLSVLNEKKAKPLFVLLPLNGRWYDHSGILSPERERCYTKVAGIIQSSGYPLADFSDHEYDEYYLKDPWHIAWKGWVDVNQAIYEYGIGKK